MIHVIDMIPTKKLNVKSHEMMFNEQPNCGHLSHRSFVLHLHEPKLLHKFVAQARKCTLVDYIPKKKNYRLLDMETRRKIRILFFMKGFFYFREQRKNNQILTNTLLAINS